MGASSKSHSATVSSVVTRMTNVKMQIQNNCPVTQHTKLIFGGLINKIHD